MSDSPGRTVAVILVAACYVAGCSDGTGPGGGTSAPLRFITIATASSSTCGIASDSTLYCWGSNAGGGLGTPVSSSCDLLQGGSVPCSTRPLRVAGAPKLTALSGGYGYFCGLDPAGAAYCWGSIVVDIDVGRSLGQTPTALPGGVALTEIATGWNHICGVTTGSAIACWGAYDSGVRGDPTVDLSTYTLPSFTPNLVGGGLSFGSVVAGALNSCALTTAGVAYCWGPVA